MKVVPFYTVITSLLIGMCCIQCTLDEGTPGTSDPALTLQVHTDLSLINLSWTPVKVTGFKEYIILQSSGDIPNSPTPPVGQDVTVLDRINIVNNTTFSTTNILFSPTSCYKLYCSVDDRFMYSSTVCVESSTTIIPGFNDRADHAPGLPQIALFDRSNIKLTAYTDDDGTIFNSIPENNLSFPQLDLSTYQGTNRLYSFDLSFAQVRKYSFPNLTLQDQEFVGESIIGGLAWNNFVFMMLQSTSSGFRILNAETLTTIDSKPGLPGNRNIAVFDGDPILVLEISDVAINRYEVNSVGKVTHSDQFSTSIFQPSTQNTCDISNEYYIGGRLSTIVNKDAEIITSLESGNNVFSQMSRFSPDGTKAAIIVSDFNAVNLEIFDISNLPVATLLKTFSLPNATFADLYFKDNVINVIGVNFNSSSPQTFFLKLPI
ncbi:MAG TPA: hypothetical protein VFF90_11880 [Saprospiraceae bacterium]|nr:hypothetical protein [Saprospiraceae bacterium]